MADARVEAYERQCSIAVYSFMLARRHATRLALQVHRLQLAKDTLAKVKGDALQVGVALLGLAEQKSPQLDFEPKQAAYDFKGWSFAQPAHPLWSSPTRIKTA